MAGIVCLYCMVSRGSDENIQMARGWDNLGASSLSQSGEITAITGPSRLSGGTIPLPLNGMNINLQPYFKTTTAAMHEYHSNCYGLDQVPPPKPHVLRSRAYGGD